MPLYEYHCRKCATKFELMRAMADSDAAATCPKGHAGAQRTLSMFAAVTKGAGGEPMPMPSSGGCGCGGGACGCGGH
jgi:putative FmdB family regulatory protein